MTRRECMKERPNILFALADDWSWPHAGVYGDKVINTPTFDRLASEGVLFTQAFCTAPTCTASRSGILTGQAIHRLDEGANLHSVLYDRHRVYPDILEEAGYHVSLQGKGWAPGVLEGSGRTRNPAGPRVDSFADFLRQVPEDEPFCHWFGSKHPHRAYEQGRGLQAGMNPDDVAVPPFLPDTREVREDILDYYEEVQQFDSEVAGMLQLLEESGRAENTIVVMTSDNGMPFPRCKANLYEMGTRMPLVVRWPAMVKGGRTVHDLVSFTDFAPTFLAAAGLPPVAEMTGLSLLDLLIGGTPLGRETVFTERERHANVRKGDLGYPIRAARTNDFLYIRNFEPDRWPAGDPEYYHSVGEYGDIDWSPSKEAVLADEGRFHDLACAKRPEEELFDLKADPLTMHNVADSPEYADALAKMRVALDEWMRSTADPRAENPRDERWDKYPYYGPRFRG